MVHLRIGCKGEQTCASSHHTHLGKQPRLGKIVF